MNEPAYRCQIAHGIDLTTKLIIKSRDFNSAVCLSRYFVSLALCAFLFNVLSRFVRMGNRKKMREKVFGIDRTRTVRSARGVNAGLTVNVAVPR